MIALIPYIRENFRRHLNPKQFVLLTEFDKLKRDYQEHQNEIHSKLINIMGERLTFHCKGLGEVQWDSPGPTEGDANAYMQGLVRETVTLHKVLTKYLGPSTTEVRWILCSHRARRSARCALISGASQSCLRSLPPSTIVSDWNIKPFRCLVPMLRSGA